MCVCIGRKHRRVRTASSKLDMFKRAELLADNSLNDGYKFPCCQLIVPTVCCILSSIIFNVSVKLVLVKILTAYLLYMLMVGLMGNRTLIMIMTS